MENPYLCTLIRFDIPKLRFYEVTRPDEQALYKCNNIGDVMAKRELKEHISKHCSITGRL